MTNAVEISDLRKTYQGDKRNPPKEALKGIDLVIPQGSFFGLLGPNGAGKSTLINIMSGLVNKTSGAVKIGGHDIDKAMRQSRLSIGVVPQELVIDTFFTVREALEIHAGYYGVPQTQRRTQEIIDAMGLSDKADINTRRLSGGMRRRVLIGKALVHNPPVLILDEPTAGVDVELRESLWAYIRKLNESGTTILLTTHYLEEAEELCDHIAVINHGEIVANDRKENLLKQLDSKQLIIEPHEPLTKLPKGLERFYARIDHGKLVIDYRPSEVSFGEIFACLRSAKITIRDLTTHEADLEDIFKQLTAA
jgi:ABC-2 type transport system ATP-binding protein